jgi:hypothetical protein
MQHSRNTEWFSVLQDCVIHARGMFQENWPTWIPESKEQNPESKEWNPESKEYMDYLT